MMDQRRVESLKRRYGNHVSASQPAMGARGHGHRHGAQRMAGKPQNTKATVKRLMSYLEQYKLGMGLAFFCVIINTVASLAGSYMLRPIINTYIAPTDGSRGDAAGLARALIVLGIVYVLGVLANYFQAKIMLTIAQKALVQLREDLFTKMQKLPVRFYDTNNNGDLMSRFTNDVDTVGQMLSSTLVQLFAGALSLVGTLALMLYTNIWLTIITLIMIPLMMKAGGFVAGRSQKYFSAQQSALGAVNGYIEETITGQKVVKVFCHEKIAEEEFGYLNDELKKNQIRAQFLAELWGRIYGQFKAMSITR